MRKILIANRGLSAHKFAASIRDVYDKGQVHLVGLCSPDDIASDYVYLTLVDTIVRAHNDIYMDVDGIVEICKKHNIDAVFPGWGYLSERSEFSKALDDNGIIFMGPSCTTIDLLGNKIHSMKVAVEVHVPVIAWSGETPLKTACEVRRSGKENWISVYA